MKTLIAVLVSLFVSNAMADYTQGYTRHNGTYVQGYQHTHADGNAYNNYGSQGIQAQPEPTYMKQPSLNLGETQGGSNPYANSTPSWEN